MKNRYSERRNKLGSMLPKNSAVVIAGASTQYRNADSSHAFRQDSNFWYLSGFNEAESTLVLLVNEKNNVKSIAFVPEKDELKEIWDGYRAGPEGAMKDHGFDLAFNNTEIDQRLPDLLAGHNQVFYPVGKSKTLDADIIEWIKSAKSKDRHSSAIDIADASSKVGNQRLIKDEDEIKIMKKACQMAQVLPSEIGFAEVYDAYAGAQFQAINALGLSNNFLKDFRDGVFNLDGKLPINISGGLMGQGAPVGATGVGQTATCAMVLEGNYHDKLQFSLIPKFALADTHGGVGTNAAVSILKSNV